MTIFSDTYERLTAGRNVRVYEAAQACRISPASLYQIFSGKRKPPSRQVVQDLSLYLQLPPSAHQELLEAYKKTVIGEEAYERRNRVENFLKYGNRLTAPINHRLSVDISMDPQRSPVIMLNPMQVLHGFKFLMHYAAVHQLPVSLRLDARCPILSDIACFEPTASVSIRQIFAVEGAPDTPEQVASLFDVLEKSMMMYTNQPHYQAYSIYSASDPKAAVFPYYGVCPGMTLLVSADGSSGILSTGDELSMIVLDHFQHTLDLASLFMEPILNPLDQLQFYQKNLEMFQGSAHLFHTRFCPTFFMDRELIETYLNMDYFPSREQAQQLLNGFDRYSSQLQQRLQDGAVPTFYISSGAVKRFLESGALEDYPKDIARPVSEEDRIKLVRRMIESMDWMDYRALKPGAGPELSNIEVWSCGAAGTISYRSGKGEDFFFRLHQDYLLRLFQEYFSTLDPEFFYTREEFRAIVERDLALFEEERTKSKGSESE